MKWLVYKNQKLAPFLLDQLDRECSGKQLRKALEANLCRVNGRIERFASAHLQKGDFVELAPSWKSVLRPNLSGFETLYEDEWLQIVNKPVNWICSPESALRAFGPKLTLVHRLDKDTTGALLLAKTRDARVALEKLFETREVEKFYLALVDGAPREESGTIESLLEKKGSFEGQTIWGSGLRGAKAVTHWKRAAVGHQASLILCQPMTGRTHQLRVHLSELGHPLLIDRQYAERFRCQHFFSRPMLHAWRLAFTHPISGKAIEVTVPMPTDLRDALSQVGMEKGSLHQFI